MANTIKTNGTLKKDIRGWFVESYDYAEYMLHPDDADYLSERIPTHVQFEVVTHSKWGGENIEYARLTGIYWGNQYSPDENDIEKAAQELAKQITGQCDADVFYGGFIEGATWAIKEMRKRSYDMNK